MKKRTLILIRIIGVILCVLTPIVAYAALQDTVFNGLDFSVFFIGILGIYFLMASPKSLSSWKLGS